MLTNIGKQRAITFLIFFFSFGRLAIAGEASEISLGDRIRVEVLDLREDSSVAQKHIGRIIRLDQEIVLLELSESGKISEISRQDILGIEVFVQGRTRGEGAVMGASIGLAIAGLTGFLPVEDRGTEFALTSLGRIVVTSLILVPLGAVFGASLAPGEHWESIQESEIQIGFGRTDAGGRGVFVRVGF